MSNVLSKISIIRTGLVSFLLSWLFWSVHCYLRNGTPQISYALFDNQRTAQTKRLFAQRSYNLKVLFIDVVGSHIRREEGNNQYFGK